MKVANIKYLYESLLRYIDMLKKVLVTGQCADCG